MLYDSLHVTLRKDETDNVDRHVVLDETKEYIFLVLGFGTQKTTSPAFYSGAFCL